MGARFTTLITRCTPFQSSATDDDEHVELFGIKYNCKKWKQKAKKIMQKKTCKRKKTCKHQPQDTKYSMPIPSIIVPPPININPSISQLLATLTPTYSQTVNTIISIIEPESDTTININYNPNSIMHIPSDISPLQSPILMINNTQKNEWNSDSTNSDSD
eukprot:730457_1